jgi:hypothetical protein
VEVKGGTVQDPFRFFALFHIDQVIDFKNGWNSGKWHGQPYDYNIFFKQNTKPLMYFGLFVSFRK